MKRENIDSSKTIPMMMINIFTYSSSSLYLSDNLVSIEYITLPLIIPTRKPITPANTYCIILISSFAIYDGSSKHSLQNHSICTLVGPIHQF